MRTLVGMLCTFDNMGWCIGVIINEGPTKDKKDVSVCIRSDKLAYVRLLSKIQLFEPLWINPSARVEQLDKLASGKHAVDLSPPDPDPEPEMGPKSLIGRSCSVTVESGRYKGKIFHAWRGPHEIQVKVEYVKPNLDGYKTYVCQKNLSEVELLEVLDDRPIPHATSDPKLEEPESKEIVAEDDLATGDIFVSQKTGILYIRTSAGTNMVCKLAQQTLGMRPGDLIGSIGAQVARLGNVGDLFDKDVEVA